MRGMTSPQEKCMSSRVQNKIFDFSETYENRCVLVNSPVSSSTPYSPASVGTVNFGTKQKFLY